MTNWEHYKEEMLNYDDNNFCYFIEKKILAKYERKCDGLSCHKCRVLQMMWLQEEYQPQKEKEPEVDWSNVEVDTQILVSESQEVWKKRYFAKYENGIVYAWDDGKTSFSAEDNSDVTDWTYAKLYKDGEDDE